jgi:spore coat polysaccharide biosynthesis protein SpsF
MDMLNGNHSRVLIVLQARIGSKRLPGKVMKPLQGEPMLVYAIRRLKKISDTKLVIATSELRQDDEIETLAVKEKTNCFRGSEKDVLDRFYRVAKQENAKTVVRATGDNPLVDPAEVERVIEVALTKKYDYIAGFHEVGGFKLPWGIGVDAFSFRTLERLIGLTTNRLHREHINNYILENLKEFKCYNLRCNPQNNCKELNLSVDTIEDFAFIEQIGQELGNLETLPTSVVIQWWKNRNQNKTNFKKRDI